MLLFQQDDILEKIGQFKDKTLFEMAEMRKMIEKIREEVSDRYRDGSSRHTSKDASLSQSLQVR